MIKWAFRILGIGLLTEGWVFWIAAWVGVYEAIAHPAIPYYTGAEKIVAGVIILISTSIYLLSAFFIYKKVTSYVKQKLLPLQGK